MRHSVSMSQQLISTIAYGIFNFSDAETRTFQDNKVKPMAADTLAPSVAKPSATMVLTV